MLMLAPSKAGRVRFRLLTVANTEATWLRVEGRGLRVEG
jgi:hypothetical protein